jgi:hypothetical protein
LEDKKRPSVGSEQASQIPAWSEFVTKRESRELLELYSALLMSASAEGDGSRAAPENN